MTTPALRLLTTMNQLLRRTSTAAALIAAAACAASASSARAAAVCGEGTYSYAGYTGQTAIRGVSATIEQAGPLAVHAGHVAGWIGVVDPSTGNAWLQVGLSALAGSRESSIYYEFAAPGHAPVYRQVSTGITIGQQHSFAVVEQRFSPGSWVVWVDGRAATRPLRLPGSHRHWTAQVLGESWAGSMSGRCNAYSYAFARVRLIGTTHATALTGRVSADPNYVVAHRTRSGFVAASSGIAAVRGTAAETPSSAPKSSQG